MRVGRLLAFVVSFATAAAVLAQGASREGRSSTPVFKPAADMKWSQLDPNVAGVMISDVWGKHATGAYGSFIKFPAGFTTPLHTHTSSARIVVISGTFVQVPEGKPEVRLGPGSYLFQPGGTYKHVTNCDKASECLIYSEGTGKFDIKPVEAAK